MDPYQTLELKPGATAADIKASYRRLAKRCHPDLHGEEGAERMRQLNAAYAILGEADRRQAYDDTRARPSYRVGTVPRRGTVVDENVQLNRWLQAVYHPVNRHLQQILIPLDYQLNELAYDPYDDTYIQAFQTYLASCEAGYTAAWSLYTGQPNPAIAARVAEYLYHCLNQVRDGLDELGYFCMNYDYTHLHTGKEHFVIAMEMRDKAAFCASKLLDS
ncbi:J domain-containing protein [Candidatus Cyanaurora vandensis]|uniref:J domain-containing protein n=1 Tax=Candidatus Cyanaurora vandensis TaxID=2714958 RepID=UPI0025803143|nr:J domain-containing protein [Candidatus Cyanaurora vandensis]